MTSVALDLPGPSRRIRVEPLTPAVPEPSRPPLFPAAPDVPERDPERTPAPEPEPARAAA